jgi:hypothetical protein
MHAVDLLLFSIAAFCFLLATVNVTARVNLVAFGLCAWVCVYVVAAARAVH